MAKSGKGKVMAKINKGVNQEKITNKVIETSEKGHLVNPNVIVKTTNMQVSEKLQKAGKSIIAITGGIIGDDKTHYLKTNLVECSKLVKDGKPLLSESELTLLEEVDEIKPSKKLYSGLKEALATGKPEKESE